MYMLEDRIYRQKIEGDNAHRDGQIDQVPRVQGQYLPDAFKRGLNLISRALLH